MRNILSNFVCFSESSNFNAFVRLYTLKINFLEPLSNSFLSLNDKGGASSDGIFIFVASSKKDTKLLYINFSMNYIEKLTAKIQFMHFSENETKMKIPSNIKPPLH